MEYKYRSEYSGGPEWGATPQEAEVKISDDLYSRLHTIQVFLVEQGLAYANKWYAAGYIFFTEGEDGNLVETLTTGQTGVICESTQTATLCLSSR